MRMPAGAVHEIALASRTLADGLRHAEFTVPGMRCAGCMAKVERTLLATPRVRSARVNLSAKKVSVTWEDSGDPPDVIGALAVIGQTAHLFEASGEAEASAAYKQLLIAVAVAGFSSMNVMMLSLSVWAGADAFSRQAFHVLSAVLALPAVLYSGRIFYASAWRALRARHTNMDVPISVGVLSAFGMSIYDTATAGPHAYFDAAASLIFFLLIGRLLDHRMRSEAQSSIAGLRRLSPFGVFVEQGAGEPAYWPVADIRPGQVFVVAPGERVALDGVIIAGTSELDQSLVTGESKPAAAGPNARVTAGVLNLAAPLRVRAVADREGSFLAQMERMMETAESGRSRYRRLADRASALYAPAVHLAALLSFAGWFAVSGDWHFALTIAIAVLIITCPCALGLAVPVVQIVAAQQLFEQGIVLRDGEALERLATVNTVLFDKTGVLTLATISVSNSHDIADSHLALAGALARSSSHPVAAAIASAADLRTVAPMSIEAVSELPGFGIEALDQDGARVRLGRASWALAGTTYDDHAAGSCVLSSNGVLLARFSVRQTPRPDAQAGIAALRGEGFHLEILSGDTAASVSALAKRLEVSAYSALTPAEKIARTSELQREGHKILMVGDGLNDLPAMAAADTSMAPASAADINRNSADLVFMNESLMAVPAAIAIARDSYRLIKQNFALAIGYNIIAVPLAVAGQVTPLLAAITMSLSSILVVGNALRLRAKTSSKPAASSARAENWQELTA